MKATVRLDIDRRAGEIDRRIFGGFLEHLGRAVYGGVYDPGSPLSDADGFRTDVAESLRALDMPCVRYPGGNFVSNYDWRDGVGPREKRPSRPDFAWKSIEPNTFGVDEFVRWCRRIGTEPMMAVNLGTLGPREAADLVEYCNLDGGTHWSDARRANGSADPHAVKLWCLGNEMDGPWQAGHCPAPEYARKARQAARLMRGIDPSVELVLCGSSGRGMATYLEWDRTVLEQCWDEVEYISAHRYSGNREDDTAWFLAEGVEIDRILDDYAGLLAYVRGLKRSDKRVFVAFDEWNVWYKNHEADGGWAVGPSLLEEVYNLEDALVCAHLNSFIRHADVVRIACLAQIVNVIAPVVDGPTYEAGARGEVPVLDVSASHDEETGAVSLFLVNRGTSQDLEVEIDLGGRRAGDRRRGGGAERGRSEGPQLLGEAERGSARPGPRRPGRRREAAGAGAGPRAHGGPREAGRALSRLALAHRDLSAGSCGIGTEPMSRYLPDR